MYAIRPGTASTFIPNCGTAQLCITSVEVIVIDRNTSVGITRRLSTSKFAFSTASTSSTLSNEKSKQSLIKPIWYSYDQYHWCPIMSIDSAVDICSILYSLLYRKPNVGMSIHMTTIVGNTRKQISSNDSARLLKCSGNETL